MQQHTDLALLRSSEKGRRAASPLGVLPAGRTGGLHAKNQHRLGSSVVEPKTFLSGSVELQIQIAAPPSALDNFIRYLENYLF
jgi:hypothetical protein